MYSGPSPACFVLVWAAVVLAACLEAIMAWGPAIFCPSSHPRLHPHKSSDRQGYGLMSFLHPEDEKSPQARGSWGVEDWGRQLTKMRSACISFCASCLVHHPSQSLPRLPDALGWPREVPGDGGRGGLYLTLPNSQPRASSLTFGKGSFNIAGDKWVKSSPLTFFLFPSWLQSSQ